MPVSGKQGCSYVYGIRNNQERCGDGSEAAAEKGRAHRAALTLFYDRKWIYDKLQRSAGE